MPGCDDCPDFIKSAVRAPVQLALDQLLAIKKLTNALDVVLNDISSGVAATLTAVVDAIPDPADFGLTAILDTLTCPITPIALFLNPTDLALLDPRELYKRLQGTIEAHIEKIIADYDAARTALADFNVIEIAKRSFDDLKRIELDAVNYARALAITVAVKGLCLEEFAEGPYDEFEAESTGFTLSDLVPDSLGTNAKALLDELQRAENKFLAWRLLSTAPVVF